METPTMDETRETLTTSADVQRIADYTLADAIRLGGERLEQTHGQWGDAVTTGCALTGAALDAELRGWV